MEILKQIREQIEYCTLKNFKPKIIVMWEGYKHKLLEEVSKENGFVDLHDIEELYGLKIYFTFKICIYVY